MVRWQKCALALFELQWCYELHVLFYLLIIWCPVHWSSTRLPLCVFFKFHMNDYTRMLRDFCLDECNRIWLASWLNPTILFVHVVLRLDSCNRGMSFSHIPGSRMWLLWGAVAFHLLHALVSVVAWGLGGWFMAIFSCAGILWLDPCCRSWLHIQIYTLKLLLLNFHRTKTCFRHCSRTIDRIDLKLAEHVPIIMMYLS